jgi:hypothetical protein
VCGLQCGLQAGDDGCERGALRGGGGVVRCEVCGVGGALRV